MRVVIDTNVIASAIFWSGEPDKVFQAALAGTVDMVVSSEIFGEYERVLLSLARKAGVTVTDMLDTIKARAAWCVAVTLPESVCDDRDDDKFIAAAIASRSSVIISGDKLLLSCSGYRNIEIIRPKQFVDAYL
ncbi:MAG: putative toxin-antitoxin system toxin component, PIN family [Gammaproteobacteria bacterium]|nr:putative toxin-antitoxin system toxin component, PIN family [Gammaproteobacteria bacterium]